MSTAKKFFLTLLYHFKVLRKPTTVIDTVLGQFDAIANQLEHACQNADANIANNQTIAAKAQEKARLIQVKKDEENAALAQAQERARRAQANLRALTGQ